ncbi:MAG TPA: hypothetical protein VK686_03950 [Bryobacteraceae bacterium]|nr:hypothetical protein [Bryobacteraceae bacterium]
MPLIRKVGNFIDIRIERMSIVLYWAPASRVDNTLGALPRTSDFKVTLQ